MQKNRHDTKKPPNPVITMKGVPDIVISNPFKEKSFYLGMSGEGKTNLVAYHLSTCTLPYVIWDEIGAISKILTPLYPQKQKIINPYQLGRDQKQALFEQTCQRVMNEGYQIFVLDEVHTYCSKRQINWELERLVTLGANRNVGFFGTSQTIRQVHNTILGNIRHFFIMRTFLKPDVDWLSAFVPKEYILQSKDLEPHGYIYYPLGGKPLICRPVKKMQL